MRRPKKPTRRRPLRFESLEDRRMLALDFSLVAGDINAVLSGSTDRDSDPASFAAIGGITYFSASTITSGQELWRTDGTAAGTWMVQDINPGPTGSFPALLTNVGGTLYFRAFDAEHGTELWKSDGTAAGTMLVREELPGTGGLLISDLRDINGSLYYRSFFFGASMPLMKSDGTAAGTTLFTNVAAFGPDGETGTRTLLTIGNTLYFCMNTATAGIELGKIDLSITNGVGTLVKDIRPGAASSSPQWFTAIGDVLYFTATTAESGLELWRSDGTPGGTILVREIAAGASSSSPTMLTAIGTTLYFWANDGTNGVELWKSDGTSDGTALVANSFAGSTGASPTDVIAHNGALYYIHPSGQLWRSGGTAGTTGLLKSTYGVTSTLTAMGGDVYILGTASSTGRELWKSDGTPDGTTFIKSFPSTGVKTSDELLSTGTSLFFAANGSLAGEELWTSDGTIGGTVLVSDIRKHTLSSAPADFLETSHGLYFTADDGIRGRELWRLDAAGVQLVADINPNALGASSISGLIEMNGAVYFRANDGVSGNEVWRLNASGPATMLKDIKPGNATSLLGAFRKVGNLLYFTADDGVSGSELWRTDGTPDGTVMVKDLRDGATGSAIGSLLDLNGVLYFVATDTATRTALWKIAAPGAEPEIVISGAAGSFEGAWAAGNAIYFSHAASTTPSTGFELWKSDGTPEGTLMLKDIVAGGNASPVFVKTVGATQYFSVLAVGATRTLWRTDGTPEGTAIVKNVGGTTTGTEPTLATEMAGSLFFVSKKSANVWQLWRSDGTDEGTILLREVSLPTTSPANLTAVRSTLYFTVGSTGSGNELWKSDGTVAGTTMVAEIRPGDFGSGPATLTNINGVLYFFANDGIHGRELWMTDGTAPGTVLAAEFNPGPGGAVTQVTNRILAYNGRMIVVAADDVRGQELWAAQLAAAPGDFDGNGRVDGNDVLIWQRTDNSPAKLAEWRRAFDAATVRPGDYDRDGCVDGDDLLVWQRALGGVASYHGGGADGSRNGLIDALDLAEWAEHFGEPESTQAAAVAVVAQRESDSLAAVAAVDAALGEFDAAALLGPFAYRAAPPLSLARQGRAGHRVGVESHAAAAVPVPRAGVVVEARCQLSRSRVDEPRLRDLRPVGLDALGSQLGRPHDGDVPSERPIGVLEHAHH